VPDSYSDKKKTSQPASSSQFSLSYDELKSEQVMSKLRVTSYLLGPIEQHKLIFFLIFTMN
jgi:hypothetical protein